MTGAAELARRPAVAPASRREACLRPEHAHRYAGIRAGQWEPAAVLADRVLAERLLRGFVVAIIGRPLLEAHFDFRGGDERRSARPRREDR
jgi:hypothetical protein